MKSSFALFAIVLIAASCVNNNTTPTNIAGKETVAGELWAEQVESNTDIKKPEGWTDADWSVMNKGVDKEKIFNSIVEQVLAGKLKAYNYITDDSLGYSVEQVKSMINRTDSITSEDPVTGHKNISVQTVEVGADDIAQVRMKEKWLFDKDNMHLEKKVMSIAFFKSVFGEDGTVKGITPLFYVKLN